MYARPSEDNKYILPIRQKCLVHYGSRKGGYMYDCFVWKETCIDCPKYKYMYTI